MKRPLSILALCGAILLTPERVDANSNLQINLFPEQPVYRTIMTDPDILKTEIQVPFGSEREVFEKPLGELSSYVSLSKTLPLASVDISSRRLFSAIPKTAPAIDETLLSDKIISTSLVVGGQLNFPENNENGIGYKTKLELFLNSPMIDTCLSEGNSFYLVGSFNMQGSVETRNLENKTIPSIFDENFKQGKYSFSADAYLVPKSPYSDQYLILRAGIDNLFSNSSEKPNINLSSTWEFPPLFYQFKMFKNFKLSPYASLHISIPTEYEKPTKASGQFGIKVGGESDNTLFPYIQVDFKKQEFQSIYTGLKLNF